MAVSQEARIVQGVFLVLSAAAAWWLARTEGDRAYAKHACTPVPGRPPEAKG